MLLSTPQFQKRIRETILRAALVTPGKPHIPTNNGETIQEHAIIQSVTFPGTNPEAQEELYYFREHLAHYSYREDQDALIKCLGPLKENQNYPIVDWCPYVALPENKEHPLHREIETGYSILEGDIPSVVDYLIGSNPDTLPIREDGVPSQNGQYPVTAIAVHIPYGDPKKTKHIPDSTEAATLLSGLTEHSHQAVAICISGPAKSVKAYSERLLRDKNLSDRTRANLASITVQEAYITCEHTMDAEKTLDRFKSWLKLSRDSERLEKAMKFCRENTEAYIRRKIVTESAWDAMRAKRDTEDQPDWEAREELHQKYDELRNENQEYESYFAEIRRSTLGVPGRDDATFREHNVDNALGKLCKASLRREKALKQETPKDKEDFPTTEALQESLNSVLEDYLGTLSDYEALQKTLLETPHNCQFEPWQTQMFLIRNVTSKQSHPGEAFNRTVKAWGEKEGEMLLAHCRENIANDTPLAWREYSGSNWASRYPTAPKVSILNPGSFPIVPEGLLPKFSDPLTPIEPPRVRLDIRLQPRSDIWTEALLDLDDLTVEAYNPVAGKPTGFKTATLWRPVITRRGIPQTETALRTLGYELDCSPQTHNYVERKVRKAEKILAPNYPLTPYEAMAYFENGTRAAQKTIDHPDTGETLWIEGKSYHITPSWRRQTMLVDHSVEDTEENEENPQSNGSAEDQDIVVLGKNTNAQNIEGGARISTLTERRINFGYSTFIVEAEGGKTYEIRETVTKDTISMEKERIAMEIEHLNSRLVAINEKVEADLKRPEREERTKLGTMIEEKTRELDEWAPMLEDFLEAFPPEAPPLASEVYGDEISRATKAILGRFGPYIRNGESGEETSLKDYQLKWAAIGAVKRGHLDGSNPGSGKTIMATMSSWYMGHHYNWVICPTIAMKTWAAELDRVGLYHEMIGYEQIEGEWKPSSGPYGHMRRLRDRFHRRIRTKNRLGKIEPEYYIISAEAVSLGGTGNKTYSPWHHDHPIAPGKLTELQTKLESGELKLPDHWQFTRIKDRTCIRVWSDRQDTAKEIKLHGFEGFLKPIKFGRAIKRCPKCEAEAPSWTKQGHCNACGHHHSSITTQTSGWNLKGAAHLKCQLESTTCAPPPSTTWQGTKTSLHQVPLYKMMGKHVGCKIIDEIHNWSNFHSQHGAALLQVRCKDSIVLSGTLCKTHIAELEPSLCQVYEPNSGEFPYAPWGMGLFKEQFQTIEMESVYRSRISGDREQIRRRNTEKVVPEASNLTKLRALLHGVMCAVGETEMEQVWNLKPIKESIRYVELQPENATIYAEWERLLQEAYEECKTEVERVGMLRRARSQMTHLAYACDGPEKLEAAITWIQESIAAGERAVVVGPSTRFYTMLSKALRERDIPFMGLGNTVPEKRYEVLNKFRDSDCPVFLSRIRLINVNFNQLTCCTRILFTGIDPSPAALRQMQKRLNRIGQTKDVHCTFLISQMPQRAMVAQDIEATLAAIENGEVTESEEDNSLENRPPSYEERLFALVLRRETAIKQTLQQADRQRDPQELYEMLRDRQTLNQLMEDIVKNAKTDPALAEQMRKMVEQTQSEEKEAEAQAQNLENKRIIEITSEEIDPTATVTAGDANPNRETKPKTKRTRRSNGKGETLSAPDGYRFTWAPVRKKRPDILQGELFSL